MIESWTTYESLDGRAVQIRDLKAFDFSLRSGSVHWLTGLQTPPEDGGTFTIRSTDLQTPLDLGATGRATERAVPWFTLDDGGGETFFGGLLWPGAWSAHLERESNGVHATFGLTSFSTTVSTVPLDTPHGYVGVASESSSPEHRGRDACVRRQRRPPRTFVQPAGDLQHLVHVRNEDQ